MRNTTAAALAACLALLLTGCATAAAFPAAPMAAVTDEAYCEGLGPLEPLCGKTLTVTRIDGKPATLPDLDITAGVSSSDAPATDNGGPTLAVTVVNTHSVLIDISTDTITPTGGGNTTFIGVTDDTAALEDWIADELLTQPLHYTLSEDATTLTLATDDGTAMILTAN